MIVFGLGKNLLFKSVLGRCDHTFTFTMRDFFPILWESEIGNTSAQRHICFCYFRPFLCSHNGVISILKDQLKCKNILTSLSIKNMEFTKISRRITNISELKCFSKKKILYIMQHYYLASLRSQLDSWKAKVKFFAKVVDAKCSKTDSTQWL